MKSKQSEIIPLSPLDMSPENLDEEHLLTLLETLIAAGCLSKDQIEAAWSLVTDIYV